MPTFGRENTDAQNNLGVGASNKVAEIRLAARPTGEQPNSSAPRISDSYIHRRNMLRADAAGALTGIADFIREWGRNRACVELAIDQLLKMSDKYEEGVRELDAREGI